MKTLLIIFMSLLSLNSYASFNISDQINLISHLSPLFKKSYHYEDINGKEAISNLQGKEAGSYVIHHIGKNEHSKRPYVSIIDTNGTIRQYPLEHFNKLTDWTSYKVLKRVHYLQRRQQFKEDLINNPDLQRRYKYQNVNMNKAIQLLKSKTPGDFIFRPSRSGEDFLTKTYINDAGVIHHMRFNVAPISKWYPEYRDTTCTPVTDINVTHKVPTDILTLIGNHFAPLSQNARSMKLVNNHFNKVLNSKTSYHNKENAKQLKDAIQVAKIISRIMNIDYSKLPIIRKKAKSIGLDHLATFIRNIHGSGHLSYNVNLNKEGTLESITIDFSSHFAMLNEDGTIVPMDETEVTLSRKHLLKLASSLSI